MKKTLSVPSALLLLFLLCARACWSIDTLSMKAWPAAGNIQKNRKTLPVCVELSNAGQHFEGTLEIATALSYKAKKGVISRQVSLPQNSQKQYFLYIPDYDCYSPHLVVELKSRSARQVVASTTVTIDHSYAKDFLVLAFTRARAGLEYLTNPRLKQTVGKDARIDLSYPDTRMLPTNWAGYESADLMILCNYPSLTLTEEQQKAIGDWVISGGVLFISSSLTPGEYNRSPLRYLLPVNPVDTLALSNLDALAGFAGMEVPRKGAVIASQVENAQGDILVSQDGHPLLVRKNFGRGSVYYCSLDITKPPFTAWEGNIDFWYEVLSRINTFRKSRVATEDGSPLSTMPQMEPPSMKNLSIFLFAYILIVGPLNYLILRRKDRMLLTFITVPVIALLFSLASYLSGCHTKGSAILFRTASICETHDGLNRGALTSYFSLFSPKAAHYDIDIKNPQCTAWELDANASNAVSLQWNDGLSIKDLVLSMWSMRRFKAREVYSFPGAAEMRLTEGDDILKGTIVNNLGIKLNNCMLISNCCVSGLFSLKTGECQISQKLSKPMANSYELSTYLIRAASLSPKEKDLDMKREQLSFMLYFSSLYFAEENHKKPILIGWSDQNISAINLLRSNYKGLDSTFFIIR